MAAAAGLLSKPFRCCVVGSGPAGFYTAKAVLKQFPNATVDMFEKMPVPFGLVRYGVAPDHLKVKNVEKTFRQVAESGQDRFSFFGNVNVGKDVAVHELTSWYDFSVFCVGASTDRRLGIPGESLFGVYGASEFVKWYNGYPGYESHQFFQQSELSKCENVVVIGQGNVALDCCRVLAKPVDLFQKDATDITAYSLRTLSETNVKNIKIVGRRGPTQAQFSVGEVRAIGKLPNVRIQMNDENDLLNLSEASKAELDTERRIKRLNKLFASYGKEEKAECDAVVDIHFYKSPVAILPSHEDPARVGHVKFEKMQLELGGEPFQQRAVGTGEYATVPCDLLITSAGYRISSVEGPPVIGERENHVPNKNAKIMLGEGNPCRDNIYASGWFRRGPTGVVLTNIEDANFTVRSIVSDVENGKIDVESRPAANDVFEHTGIDRNHVVTWDEFLKIDKYEMELGKVNKKVREKITDRNQMVKVAKR